MTKMVGPLLTDTDFFRSCLQADYPGMEPVMKAVRREDWRTARHAYAAFVRSRLQPEAFFRIPYEVPENTYTLPGETERESADRICTNTLISCGTPLAFGSQVDWFANPTDNQYREWTWQLSRHNEWKLLAHVYRESRDERYAQCCARLFASWVRQAVCPGNAPGSDTLCWRTIECGIRMGANWPYTLHAFSISPAFTDDILVDWHKSVWEQGKRLHDHHMHGNWLIMEMNGLAQIGILCPEFAQADAWRTFALRQLEEELHRQLYDDGFQYELSTGYHDVVINNYQRLIRVARAYHVLLPDSFLPALENAASVNLKLMMPNGCLPDINDGCGKEVSRILAPKLELFPHRPDFLWAVTRGREGAPPPYASVALPFSGFLVMRENWRPDAVWALLDAAPFGRGHQHEDKLSLLLFSGGRLRLTEGGNYAYDDSEMRRYVLSTRAHNTVRVDGLDQNRRRDYHWEESDIARPSGMRYSIGPEFDYAESEYSEGYGPQADRSVTHRRAVYFIKHPPEGLRPFFLVADRLEAGDPHIYEFLWHLDSALVSLEGRTAHAEGLHLLHSAEGAGLTLTSGQESPEWQGWKAAGTTQGDFVPIFTLTVQVKAQNCRVVTLLYPCADGCPVAAIEASGSTDDTHVVLHLCDGSSLTYCEPDMKGSC